MSSHDHKKNTPRNLRVGIITISTSRVLATDKTGQWISKRAEREKHTVVRHVVIPDQPDEIRTAVCDAINQKSPHLLILTGGTGLTPTDVTIEAVRPLFKKELTAFGPAVTQLSMEKIDSAAIMSRSTAGIIGQSVVFCLPGSMNACKLICKALIFPEAGHLVKHISDKLDSCNTRLSNTNQEKHL